MRVIKSSQLDDLKLDDEQRLWVYNGLDCALTHEIYSALLPQVDKHARRTYDFERGMAACAINLILRGWAVDKDVIAARTVELEASQKLLMAATNKIANAVWGKDINVNSPVQLKRILYEELAIPPQMRNAKGKMKVSTDREALEAVARQYPRGRPLALFVLAIRDTVKKLSVLKSTLDGDGRMRCSYNVAGTECLSGDTLVVTASGIRPLADIYNSTSYKTHLWNGNEFVNPVKKVCYKNTEGLEILLANGTTLRCSKNHPFAVERIGWVEARNLVLGQSLVNSIPNTLFGTVVTPYSKSTPVEFYELLGMLLADGTLHSSNGGYSIRISNRDPEVQARFVELVKYLFPEAVPRCYKDYAHVSHRPLYDMLEPVWATALSKTIPKWALRGTPIALRALLRGLTLDSHVTSKKNGLIFGSASDKLRTQIQTMLKYLGIESISYNFKLVLPRRETAKFLKLCGFVQSSKLDKVATLLNRFRKTSAEFNYNEVVAVKPWRGAVYDCTMPSSSPPQYSAAGLLVHNTGRWSSSSSPFNTGTNLQNVTKDLRGIFVPDPGYVLFDADLEQAESRVVAYLSEDEGYIKACEEGDLHTTVVKMIWPHRDWTGDLQRDRAMAEEKYYRDFSYRDICKRAGHGANYGLTVDSLARHLRIHNGMRRCFRRGTTARPCHGATLSAGTNRTPMRDLIS